MINKLINIISFSVLIITLVGVLYNNQLLLMPSATAKSDTAESQTTYSISCIPTTELNLVSHFNIIGTFNDQLPATMAVTNLQNGESIVRKSARKDISNINNQKHMIAMFEGPNVAHHAFCPKEKIKQASLNMAQISQENNPPILTAQGSETNIKNYKQVPNNAQFYNVVNNGMVDKINFGFKAGYGHASSNNYRIAISKPLNSDQQTYIYDMLVSSTLH